MDVVYLDFAKAFDKLDFNITLKKMSMLVINGKNRSHVQKNWELAIKVYALWEKLCLLTVMSRT